MPIQIDAKYTVVQAANIMDADIGLAQELESQGVKLVFTNANILFHHPKQIKEIASVNIPWLTFKSVADGKFGITTKSVMTSFFNAGLNQAAAALGIGTAQQGIATPVKPIDEDLFVDHDPPTQKPSFTSYTTDKTLEEVLEEAPKVELDLSLLTAVMNQPPVKLKDATKLYQPVRGTGSDSKYFAVALSQQLKIAARLNKTGDYSIRVEGDVSKFSKKLSEAGFGSSSSGVHFSLHGKVDLKEHDQVFLGVVVIAQIAKIKHHFPKVMTDFTPIIGKGAGSV